MVDSLTILTPWYPSASKPFGGAFVRTQAMAVRDQIPQIDVIHLDEWPMPHGERVQGRVRSDLLKMVGAARTRPRAVVTAEGQVTRVPIAVVPKAEYADTAEVAVETLRAALPGGVIESDVVHAHVGLPAGLAAVRLSKPGAVVVVTEHATFLWKMLQKQAGYELYDEVLAGCSVFVAVSVLLRDELVEAFPHHANKIIVVPNVVPFETIPPRPAPVTALKRWLYLGSFQQRKGVMHLLEAFAICHDDDPELSLTLVGGGPQSEDLKERAAVLGIEDAVDVREAVGPDEVYPLYHQHDLLVHASRYETFGMTIVEAIAAGMPVLVTACGGPQETLGDLDGAAGELVGISETPTELVRGFRALRDRFAGLDLDHASQVLEGRYGARPVGDRLVALYTDPEGRP